MDHSLKGKSVNTSVPTIAVRFNATAEEIEELYQSEDDSSEQTHSDQTKPTGDLESSPLRYLSRLGKRSVSTDNTLASHDSSPTSDPWKFFAGIKGKITKNIEDTITEIKHRNQEGDGTTKKPKECKDNLSDSEDISESSISKTCGAASTTEGVEMSTDDDTSSLEKDTKCMPEQQNIDTVSITPEGIRQRIKLIKKEKCNSGYKESSVTLKALGKLVDLHSGVNSSPSHIPHESVEVESGVEALEDALLQNSSSESKMDQISPSPEELITNATEQIANLEYVTDDTIVVQPVTGDDIQNSYVQQHETIIQSYFAPEGFVDLRKVRLRSETWFGRLYSFRRFLFVICLTAVYIFGAIPVYLSGFIAGAVFAVTCLALYSTFISPDVSATCFPNKPAGMLVTVPEIKEHIPISSIEGWMNEYPDVYDPVTYHVSQTQSVYVRLQGNLLRISHTRAKIPKRAMWNEPKTKHKHLFTHYRIYNVLGARVALLPDGLHKKRHWSKKYPICIILNNDQLNFECHDEVATVNDVKDQSSNHNLADGISDKKDNHAGKNAKKTMGLQPQVYSKLTDEDLAVDFDEHSPEIATELELDEMDNLGSKLHDNLLLEDDEHNRSITAGQDEEQVDEDIVSMDEWSTYSPLESPTETPTETHIYLFGRTGREKEDWFRRLTMATHNGSDILSYNSFKSEPQTDEAAVSEERTHSEAQYLKYMSQFIKASKRKNESVRTDECIQTGNVLWLNAAIGRILYDWSKDAGFINSIREKIQRKLMTIKLPYFIEQLNVNHLSLGDSSPLVHNTGKPVLDQRGLWVDLDISYEGNIVLTLQTKLNLMKLKEPQSANASYHSVNRLTAKWQSSDVEDTAESSTDEEGRISPPPKIVDDKGLPSAATSTKSRRLMKMVDKITESKIFQAATDNRYIKKAMEGVSNTDLSLKVEVKGLIGTLVFNIPPPPTDRLWIGFRPTPKIFLTAHPIVGVRNISFIRYLTNWIEKKLCQEFQKLLVIPNMEDFSIPSMSSDLPK